MKRFKQIKHCYVIKIKKAKTWSNRFRVALTPNTTRKSQEQQKTTEEKDKKEVKSKRKENRLYSIVLNLKKNERKKGK